MWWAIGAGLVALGCAGLLSDFLSTDIEAPQPSRAGYILAWTSLGIAVIGLAILAWRIGDFIVSKL